MVDVAQNTRKTHRFFRRTLFASCLTLFVGILPAGLIHAQSTQGSSAEHYKELGDQSVAQDHLSAAADAYERALSLGREQFTLEDRVRMAIYLSWENRLAAAIDELRHVLKQDPSNLPARIHLARVCAWDGQLDEAIAQANAVLRISPNNQEALLVKADSLQWKGFFKEAIPIYRKILKDQNRFEAGLGLSYALLSAGNYADARKSTRSLTASSTNEKNRLDRLRNELDGVARPKVDVRYNYYEDSDRNHADRYSLLYGVALGNQSLELNLKRTNTQSQTEDNSSEAASFNLVSNVAEGLRFGIGMGLRRAGLETKRNFATGQFRIDGVVSNATLRGSFSTDLLDDTSDLIDTHVRVSSYAGQVSKPWTGRFSTSGGYTYKTFSDGNRAQEIQFTPQYRISASPRIAMGYRFRFLDFRGQSGSGFFDPDNYVSHRVFGSISVEKEKVSTYLDLFTGKQRFSRYAASADDWIVGGSASIAFKPIRQLLVEINGEGGNFIGESIAGFKYGTAGVRLSYRF